MDDTMRDSDKNRDTSRRGFEGTTGTMHTDNAGGGTDSSQGGMMDMARNVGEQAWAAASNPVATAQDLARRAGEQTYEQGARAGQYLTRNVNEYPLTALFIAGAIGYGLGYLFHSNWQYQGWSWNWNRDRDWSDHGRHDRRHDRDHRNRHD